MTRCVNCGHREDEHDHVSGNTLRRECEAACQCKDMVYPVFPDFPCAECGEPKSAHRWIEYPESGVARFKCVTYMREPILPCVCPPGFDHGHPGAHVPSCPKVRKVV